VRAFNLRDLPQIAVQQLLDHESPRMTNIYARLHDQTLRAEFDRYQQRINIRGETVPLEPDGPLSDAAWAKRTSPARSRRSPTATAAYRSSSPASTRTPA
jgi:hypothetical protein